MNHTEAIDYLNEYLDNELPAEKVSSLEGHLHSCSECQKSFDNLKKIRTALFNRPDPLSDQTFVSRVMDRLESETEEPSSLLSWRSWKLPVFSFGLAGLTLFLTFQTVRMNESINSVLFIEDSNSASSPVQPDYQPNDEDLLAQVAEGL